MKQLAFYAALILNRLRNEAQLRNDTRQPQNHPGKASDEERRQSAADHEEDGGDFHVV